MDYKKAYKEAHSRAEMFRNTIYKGVAEEIFPDLRESSYDEKIRKELIEMVKEDWPGRSDVVDWLEKQGEQKEYTFKSLPRLLDMIEPTNKAKAYCQKLIDTLVKEGYSTDAKIVGECLKGMNGEDVPMAIMDEKQGEQKPAWSEEDETTRNNISHIIRQLQNKQKRKSALLLYNGDCLLWMQNIKDRVQPQPKQEWSHNDNMILETIEHEIERIPAEDFIDFAKDRCLEWLRHRVKSLRPNHWKPSDEQIKVCKEVYADILSAKGFDLGTVNSELNRLEEQLKKLKG